jgi:hypothetical protein
MEIFDSGKFGTLSIQELKDFEKENEITLPLDYRNFLLTPYNGGKPNPNKTIILQLM